MLVGACAAEGGGVGRGLRGWGIGLCKTSLTAQPITCACMVLVVGIAREPMFSQSVQTVAACPPSVSKRDSLHLDSLPPAPTLNPLHGTYERFVRGSEMGMSERGQVARGGSRERAWGVLLVKAFSSCAVVLDQTTCRTKEANNVM